MPKKVASDEIVSALALANHMFCTRETVFNYVNKGIISKRKDGKYDQNECREKILTYLRDKSAGRTGSNDLSDQKAELAKEQVESARLKNAVARGDMVSLGKITTAVQSIMLVIRENLLGIPGAKSDELTMRTRDEVFTILRTAISEALDELSRLKFVGRDDGSGGKGRMVKRALPASESESSAMG